MSMTFSFGGRGAATCALALARLERRQQQPQQLGGVHMLQVAILIVHLEAARTCGERAPWSAHACTSTRAAWARSARTFIRRHAPLEAPVASKVLGHAPADEGVRAGEWQAHELVQANVLLVAIQILEVVA